jgi:hypothetical protein
MKPIIIIIIIILDIGTLNVYCRKMLEFFKIKIKIRIVEVFKNTENEQLFRS